MRLIRDRFLPVFFVHVCTPDEDNFVKVVETIVHTYGLRLVFFCSGEYIFLLLFQHFWGVHKV